LAEEYKDLSNGTKRVDYFNEKVKELKESKPEVAEVPPAAFDIARRYALQSAFPPFGMINFPEEPGNPMGDPKKIEDTAEKVIFGAARFISSLQKDSPEDLMQRGIDTFKGFDDSKAVNDLLGVTKMSFENVRSGLADVEEAIAANDKEAEDPFEGKSAFKNLKPEDISALLDSTVIKFIKEIGLKREDEERDKQYLDRAEQAISKIPKEEAPATKKLDPSKLNTAEDPEYMARLEKARKEEALMDAAITSKDGAKIATSKPEPIKEAEIKKTEATPAATPTPAPAATPAAAPAASSVTEATPVAKTETPAPPPATQAVAVTPPTPTPPARQEQKSQVLNLAGSGSNASGGDFSVLKAMGISDADIKNAFNGADISVVQKALDESSFNSEGSTSASSMTTIATPATEPVKTPETTSSVSKTTSVSEPVKLATSPPASPTPAPTPTPTAETKKEETSSEEKSKESQKEPAKSGETTKSSAENANNETNKEMLTKMDELTKSNNDLLNVMRQVLSTLQSPLIVTDSKHNFH